MVEMRRPMDFWKGLVGFFLSFCLHLKRLILRLYETDHCANRDLRCLPCVWSICIRMYIPFGFYFSSSHTTICILQSFQGQFTLPLAFQGVTIFSWQSFGGVKFVVIIRECNR